MARSTEPTAPFLLRALLLAPALALLLAFFLLPLARLAMLGFEGQGYWAAITAPRSLRALRDTVLLSAAVALVAVALAAVVGSYLARHRFPGRRLLVALLTLPLAFPGVVVGFLVILLAGRQGLVGGVTEAVLGERLVFAYSFAGLFAGYLYFSLPRCIATIMAAAEALDPALEEAARSLGAGRWRVARDVILPGLAPALVAAGAICFATAMGALGTAFTLATDTNVLPMLIYTEFTLATNLGVAASLSVLLGATTWLVLALARGASGTVAANA
jgi:putative spermidine/putrescine transport system permease protein